jgi:hypothetical protein
MQRNDGRKYKCYKKSLNTSWGGRRNPSNIVKKIKNQLLFITIFKRKDKVVSKYIWSIINRQ